MAIFARKPRPDSKLVYTVLAGLFVVVCLAMAGKRVPLQARQAQQKQQAQREQRPRQEQQGQPKQQKLRGQARADSRIEPARKNPLAKYLPPVDVSVTRVPVQNPFQYAFLGWDGDSYQVKDENIRALEPGLTALWIDRTRECCKRGGHVIDVGAHFGYYSLLAASLGCHFTAFEPVPAFAAVIHLNLQLNAIPSSNRLLNAAVGLGRGQVNMTVPKSGVLGLAHVQTNPEEQKDSAQFTVKVPMMTLEDGMSEGGHDVREVCGMKVDVEGFEPDVIQGGRDYIRNTKVQHIMMEFSPGYRQEGLPQMLEVLHNLGYTAIEIFWDWAKVAAKPLDVDLKVFDAPEHRVDISTPQARKALIDRILPVYNTNLLFSLKEPSSS